MYGGSEVELPITKVDGFFEEFRDKEKFSYDEIRNFWGNKGEKSKAFSFFITATLLFKLARFTKRTKIWKPWRITNHWDNWCGALIQEDTHKSFTGKVLFESKNGELICHPTNPAELKCVKVLSPEIGHGVAGVYEIKAFEPLISLHKNVLKKKQLEILQERHKILGRLKIEKLLKLKLIRRGTEKGTYDFSKIRSLYKKAGRQYFARETGKYILKNDPKSRRFLLSLELIERFEPHLRRQYSTFALQPPREVSKSDNELSKLSYLNFKALENFSQQLPYFGAFIDSYYHLGPRKFPYYTVFLACHLDTLSNLRLAAKYADSRFFDIVCKRKLLIHNNKKIIKLKRHAKELQISADETVSDSLSKIRNVHKTKYTGLEIDINPSGCSCESNMFIVSKIPMSKEEFQKSIVRNAWERMVYYPQARFNICSEFGISRFEFDKKFLVFCKDPLRQVEIKPWMQGYAIADSSHTISRELTQQLGYFDTIEIREKV